MNKVKLIIFDLDGVLCSTREAHFNALNQALYEVDPKYIITKEQHLSKYDGLSTAEKLNTLSVERGLPREKFESIWKRKQTYTFDYIDSTIKEDQRLIDLFKKLRSNGYKLAVASNAIRYTVKIIILNLGLMRYVDFFYSNEDVKNTKPNPEIYMKCMINGGVSPKQTLIVEDSDVGRKAAQDSGAHLCAVMNPDETTYEKIMESINKIENKTNLLRPQWQGGKMNVLIPMAGKGSRFEQAGYTFPKPLIEVNGKPMIQVVVENLNIDAKHIFIVQKEHYDKYNLKTMLNLIKPNCEIVVVDGITEGAACTTLLAKEFIDNGDELLLANSDQFVEWDSNKFLYSMQADSADAGILTFNSTHPKWSFAALDNEGNVCKVAEKNPISDLATVGIYYWKKGSDYVKFAEQMIAKDIRVNSEFYVCPVFNEAILAEKKIKTYNCKKMWGIGTPEDLRNFVDNYNWR